MAALDATVRDRLAASGELFNGYNPQMRAVHRRNGERLTVILDELGVWPGFTLVGEDGSEAAFIIGQHDIANPPLIRRCRDLYRAAVATNEAAPARLAALEDRIRYFEGREQAYGTHWGWNRAGQFGPWPPVEDPDNVDERRARVELPPLADALATARRQQSRPLVRPIEEVLSEHDQAERFAIDVGWRTGA